MTPSFDFEAVHLDEQLIERLLALVIAAAEAGAAMAADRVDFIDEDDAGRVLLRLLEHVAHAAGADAHEHFDEVRAGDREERHIRFAGDGAGEQRLAGARRTDEQHALRDAAAEPLEFLRIAQEFDDLFQFFLGFVDAGDVFERHAAGALGEQLGAALAEAHRLAAAGLHLAQEENPHADEEQHREPVDEDAHQDGTPSSAGCHRDVDLLRQHASERGRDRCRRVGREGLAVAELVP